MTAFFKKTPRSQQGFTMIELLVVATIIVVLTTIGLVSYTQALQNGRNAKRKTDLEVLRQALVLYKADNGYYPNTDTAGLQTTLGTTYVSSFPVDPKATQSPTFTYTYTPGTCSGSGPVRCQTFTLAALLESGSSTTAYSITNP
jgi:general secretion pathway protein G